MSMHQESVACKCSHVFIKSSVDLQLGEKFANTDYAFAHAIQNTKYKESAGHFQGETAEQPWIELNQLAPQTRQMNNGHRQDTIIDHHSFWNWLKTVNMVPIARKLRAYYSPYLRVLDSRLRVIRENKLAQIRVWLWNTQLLATYTLQRELVLARDLFISKQAAFKTMFRLYSDKIPAWDLADRHARVLVGKEIACVYRQTEIKGIAVLNEGILIKQEQTDLGSRVTEALSTMDTSTEKELNTRRKQLETRLEKWRKAQKTIMPHIGDYIVSWAVSGKGPKLPENEKLFLPSDFTVDERRELGLTELGNVEYRLREGSACDAVMKLRTISKLYHALAMNTKAEAKGQVQHTRARVQEIETLAQRDAQIFHYNEARRAMISLGLAPDSANYPPLTVKDTFRKATNVKRAVGDSRRIEGLIYTNQGRAVPHVQQSKGPTSSGLGPTPLIPDCPRFGTCMVQFSKGSEYPINHLDGPKGKKRKLNEDGWIWSFRPSSQISDEQVEKWAAEGDRVQWFRAEAEMKRWQEQWEIKQAELLRCIRTFSSTSKHEARRDGAACLRWAWGVTSTRTRNPEVGRSSLQETRAVSRRRQWVDNGPKTVEMTMAKQ
ncbi:hypothetical protein CPC08DRAFT_729608 [Agrocybe pediades]|nr:hypothetical protein CPC08DRAFT_729608 [Agrocybe pediades]